jgi:ATP-dependent Clp protease protease subunit
MEPEERDEREEPKLPTIPSDLANRLFKSRTVIISGEVNQKLAAAVIAQLVGMASESDDDITVFINSQGGHVESGDTIHDIVRYIKPRVKMIGTGWVASAGALIYVAVPQEDRFSLPNTRYLLHQPAGGMSGTASDIEIEAEEILRMRRRLNEIFAQQTGQPIERIEQDTHRNFWLSAQEAKEYGLVGHIIASAAEVE